MISFTFSSESSGCLQIILTAYILPMIDLNPYFPLLTNAVKRLNNSTSFLVVFHIRKGILSTRKVRYLIPKRASYYNWHYHMVTNYQVHSLATNCNMVIQLQMYLVIEYHILQIISRILFNEQLVKRFL